MAYARTYVACMRYAVLVSMFPDLASHRVSLSTVRSGNDVSVTKLMSSLPNTKQLILPSTRPAHGHCHPQVGCPASVCPIHIHLLNFIIWCFVSLRYVHAPYALTGVTRHFQPTRPTRTKSSLDLTLAIKHSLVYPKPQRA